MSDLEDAIADLERRLQDDDGSIERAIRANVCERFPGHTFEEIAEIPENVVTLDRMRKNVKRAYQDSLRIRIDAIRCLRDNPLVQPLKPESPVNLDPTSRGEDPAPGTEPSPSPNA
jgi:hypothetical protein